MLAALAIWYFAFAGDEAAGKPVPAPRSLPTAPSESQPLTGQTLTIGAEQRENAGLVIETVGEQLAAELGLTAATGVVEPNAYRNTPLLPLVGGVVGASAPSLAIRSREGRRLQWFLAMNLPMRSRATSPC